MNDVVDRAQELEQLYRDQALARHKAAHRVPVIVGDGEHIVHPRDCSCGDPIPMPRLLRDPFAERCVPCQIEFEKHQ